MDLYDIVQIYLWRKKGLKLSIYIEIVSFNPIIFDQTPTANAVYFIICVSNISTKLLPFHNLFFLPGK